MTLYLLRRLKLVLARSYPAVKKHDKGFTMRWCVCKEWGPPSSLVTEEGPPLPQPGAGEVAIAVSACAVNFPDLLVVQVGVCTRTWSAPAGSPTREKKG